MAHWSRLVASLLQRSAPKIKTLMALIGLCVLAMIAAELISRVVLLVDDSFLDPPETVRFFNASAYPDAPYDFHQLTLESERSSEDMAYVPYTIWSQRAFTGDLVNVDEIGNRVTLNNSDNGDALKVWVFGGSTLWGWGAPDSLTIPSELSRIFNETWGVDARVTNFGELGFVSTQELVALTRALQNDNGPDLVVFFDGINDAATVHLWPGVSGTHHNLTGIRAKLEKTPGQSLISQEAGSDAFVESLGLYRISQHIKYRLGLNREESRERRTRLSSLELQGMAEKAVDIWFANYRITDALAKGYGFTNLFFLQPSIWSDWKPLAASESEIFWNAVDMPVSGPTLNIRVLMTRLLESRLEDDEGQKRIYDLWDNFQAIEEPLFIDQVHITGRGNQIVAERMFETIALEICSEAPPKISELTRVQLSRACN